MRIVNGFSFVQTEQNKSARLKQILIFIHILRLIYIHLLHVINFIMID